jgi:hypothetical protein
MSGSSCRAALGALVALACLPLAAQQVYKSVDAQGHVVYSDRGATKTAPKTDLRVDEPDPVEAARLAKQQQILDAQEQQRLKEQTASDHAKALEDRKRLQKQKACENARNSYYRLQETNRLFKRDADGNRVYYSDAEAETMRQQAKQAMTAACG